MEDKKKLMRSSSDKWLAGVLGGIANYLGWDPALLRLCYLLLTLCSVGFPGVIASIILWMCMPQVRGIKRNVTNGIIAENNYSC